MEIHKELGHNTIKDLLRLRETGSVPLRLLHKGLVTTQLSSLQGTSQKSEPFRCCYVVIRICQVAQILKLLHMGFDIVILVAHLRKYHLWLHLKDTSHLHRILLPRCL